MDAAKLEQTIKFVEELKAGGNHLAQQLILNGTAELLARIQAGELDFSVEMRVGDYFYVANRMAILAVSWIAQELCAYEELSLTPFGVDGAGAFNFKRKTQAAA